MSESGQRSRPWPQGDAAMTPSEPAAADDARGEATTLRDFGTSMDAISFGFAATAILISIFLLMAIFEHLIRPQAFQAPADSPGGRRRRGHRSPGKPRSPPMVQTVMQAADLSVLMPGQRYPTYLAQPAPLPSPCPREGMHWPPHDHHRSHLPP
ncbi:uncharacterized protein LOC119281815 [Triticum dicoccoides]|uniref:uncharacterized protein LOC119281815 n=1 Tax=Triticum dicoccoides TaxID=85692 RepID=UPI000E7C232A|nr:uncharacterized protein LOC119281815 [Triticum dicoccoides]